jgi:PKD repeat protein
VPSAFTGDTYCVVGTKQDRAPYINESVVPIASNPPVADFSGTPTTILEGESVTFTDASQYALTWSWNFGDGGSSTDQNPVHVYTTAGTYNVALTITNGIGPDTETKDNYITVNVNTNAPTADFEASQTTVNVGGTVDFTDLSTDNPASWDWEFDGGSSVTSTDQNPSIVYNTIGIYTVALTATNIYGDDFAEKTNYIEVVVEDLIMADGESTQCEGLFKDPGGDGDYLQNGTDNIEYTHTIYPSTSGASVRLSFSMLDVEPNGTSDCYDYITIYDGENISATEIGTYCGTDYTVIGDAGVVTSSDPSGALTIYFLSDPLEVGAGWIADISCYAPIIPPTADFISDVTSTCTGAVQFTDASTLANSWLWNFGDGQTSTDQNPQHTYTADGTYTVSLFVENAYGDDTYSITDMITVDMPDSPTTTGAEACGPSSLTLNASGAGSLNWYDAATDGNFITNGSEYTNTFANTTTLYVQSGATPEFYSGGSSDINSNGDNHTSNGYYLIFSAYEDFRLVSVQVNSSTAGDRVVELRNSSDAIIESQTVSLTTGINTITLNFDIPVGTDYQLKCGTAVSNLWRNNTATNWPYEIGGVASITGTNAGDVNYYYYYYNWEIMTGDDCLSARTPVVATINDIPVVDNPSNVTECDSYTLPALTNGAYFENTGGVNPIPVGTEILVDQTIYVYAETGTTPNCFAENSFTVIILEAPLVDDPTDVTACETYTLPALTDGDYFETTGGLNPLSVGDVITLDQTIYVYAVNGDCEAENSFEVTINDIPVVDDPSNVIECYSYTLPDLTNGAYFENTGGVNPIPVGTEILVDQTIYVYAETGTTPNCFAENSFTVTILEAPLVDDPTDVTACETYTLLALTDGDYYETTGGVDPLSIGDVITLDQTIYVYATNGTCDSENSFIVTIDDMPLVDNPSNVEECESYTLPALINGVYFENTGGVGLIPVGTAILVDQTIYVYATNGECEAENSFDVIINPGFTASAVVSDETGTGANDGSITVTMTGGSAPFEGTWTPSGTTNTAGSSMVLSGLSGGYYSVVVEDANGCTASAVATVNTIGALPVAEFEADAFHGCGSLTVSFTDLSNNMPTDWSWEFGDGETSVMPNPTHTYSTPGIYTVSLTVTNVVDSDDEIKEDYITLGVTPMLVLGMTEESLLGNDGTATVTAYNGEEPYGYLWSNGIDTPTITGLTADEYCVTVTEAYGCTVVSCIEVTQETVSNDPVADFSADGIVGCGTLTVNFTDLSTNSPTSWYWTFGDATTSIMQNPVHTYSAPGTYTVTLVVENADGEGNISMIDYIVVNENPALSIDVTPASGEIVPDGSAIVNITGGSAPYNVTWSDSQTGDNAINLVPGNYSVVVVDANNCFATQPFIVNWVNSVGISELTYSIYPNPASEEVFIQFDGQLAYTIQVYDMLGKVVLDLQPMNDVNRLDVSKLQNGVYFVKIRFDNMEYTHKLVID